MSSVLKRRKKRMEPLGYTKKELDYIGELSKQKRHTENLVEEAYLNIKLIAYQILHDKFGFGKKRIARVDDTIDTYLVSGAEGKMSAAGLTYFLEEKCSIDVREEAKRVPFREQFYILRDKVVPADMQDVGKILNASIINYFSLLGVCLKTQFRFSARQIREVFDYIRDYINTLSRYKQFELKIEDIAVSVKAECGYIDKRFIGETRNE